MKGWRRWLATVLLLALTLPEAVSAAPRPRRKPAPPARPVVAAPVLAPVRLARPTMASPTAAVKKTELEEWQQKKAKANYEQEQAKLLALYAGAGDSRAAFAIDKGLAVTPAPRMQEYLQLLTDELLGCWKAPRPPVKIVVVARADPFLRAYGSGLIEISTGSLKGVYSTDVLAFLVAHELAHILKEDEVRREGVSKTLVNMLTVATTGAMYANEVVVSDNGQGPAIGFRKDFGSADLMIATYGGQAVIGDVFKQVWGAKQEFTADRLAFDLVNCVSRDAVTAVDRGMEALHKAERPPLDKIKQAAALAALYIGQQVLKPKAGDSDWLQLAKLAALVGMMGSSNAIADAIAKSVDAKMSPTQRIEELNEYLDKVYGPQRPAGAGDTDPELGGLQKEAAWTELNALVEGNRPLDEMIATAMAPRAALATKPATQAAAPASGAPAGAGKPAAGAAKPGDTAPPPEVKPITLDGLLAVQGHYRTDPRLPNSYRVMGMVTMLKGDRRTARGLFESGARYDWASRDHMLNAGALQAGDGDGTALDELVNKAETRLGKAPGVLPLKVWRAVVGGDVVKAETLSAECLSKGGFELYQTCTASLAWDPLCAPRSPEGKAKMEEAVLSKEVEGLFSLTGMVGKVLGSKSKAETRCAAAANVAAKDDDQ